jgi:hypothetical protein
MSPFQKASMPTPRGETTPMPVTTTRRMRLLKRAQSV